MSSPPPTIQEENLDITQPLFTINPTDEIISKPSPLSFSNLPQDTESFFESGPQPTLGTRLTNSDSSQQGLFEISVDDDLTDNAPSTWNHIKELLWPERQSISRCQLFQMITVVVLFFSLLIYLSAVTADSVQSAENNKSPSGSAEFSPKSEFLDCSSFYFNQHCVKRNTRSDVLFTHTFQGTQYYSVCQAKFQIGTEKFRILPHDYTKEKSVFSETVLLFDGKKSQPFWDFEGIVNSFEYPLTFTNGSISNFNLYIILTELGLGYTIKALDSPVGELGSIDVDIMLKAPTKGSKVWDGSLFGMKSIDSSQVMEKAVYINHSLSEFGSISEISETTMTTPVIVASRSGFDSLNRDTSECVKSVNVLKNNVNSLGISPRCKKSPVSSKTPFSILFSAFNTYSFETPLFQKSSMPGCQASIIIGSGKTQNQTFPFPFFLNQITTHVRQSLSEGPKFINTFSKVFFEKVGVTSTESLDGNTDSFVVYQIDSYSDLPSTISEIENSDFYDSIWVTESLNVTSSIQHIPSSISVFASLDCSSILSESFQTSNLPENITGYSLNCPRDSIDDVINYHKAIEIIGTDAWVLDQTMNSQYRPSGLSPTLWPRFLTHQCHKRPLIAQNKESNPIPDSAANIYDAMIFPPMPSHMTRPFLYQNYSSSTEPSLLHQIALAVVFNSPFFQPFGNSVSIQQGSSLVTEPLSPLFLWKRLPFNAEHSDYIQSIPGKVVSKFHKSENNTIIVGFINGPEPTTYSMTWIFLREHGLDDTVESPYIGCIWDEKSNGSPQPVLWRGNSLSNEYTWEFNPHGGGLLYLEPDNGALSSDFPC